MERHRGDLTHHHHRHHQHHRADHQDYIEQHSDYPQQQQHHHHDYHHHLNRPDNYTDPNQNLQYNNNNIYDHRHSNPDFNYQMSSEPNEPFGGGGFRFNGRKRGRYNSGSVPSPDHNYNDGGSITKLYVAPVPRTTTEQYIHSLFQEHGSVIEVVLPKDKWSGQQQGYCFVKYATLEDADRAIRALNSQLIIPGEAVPIKVRYADGERERLGKGEREYQGGFAEKLYVGSVSKQASKQEIEEIFSPYGHVEDVYIARDELKQSRGCAFIKFSHRDMAVAAMKSLNGNFTMRGCDQPLIVRFADPKKPRTGELRGNYAFGGANFGPCSQEPIIRPISNFGDSMGGSIMPNASYPLQEISTNSLPHAVSHMTKEVLAAPCITEQPLPPKQTQNLEQQQSSQNLQQKPMETGSYPQAASSTSAPPAVSSSPQTEDLLECDWSEHTCPDGYKYYYNCITCESRWEKPEEFNLFQQRLQKQQKLHNPNKHPCSPMSVCSAKDVCQTQKDLDHLRIKSETSPVVDPTCV